MINKDYSLSTFYLIYTLALIHSCEWMCMYVYVHLYICTCVCAHACLCLYLWLPEVPLRVICFEFWLLFWVSFFFFLLKVSAEAVKRYRSENITSPKGLLGGSHFMCQTPLFQDKYLTCFVTWLNLHVFRSGLLLSEALCCEMKITGICLPNAVIQRIVN